MADDEPVDPKRELEDRCKAPCTRPLKEYQERHLQRGGCLYRPPPEVFPGFNRGWGVIPLESHSIKAKACSKRIEGDDSGHKHCTGQYFDYWRCVDKCVATKLFTHLK